MDQLLSLLSLFKCENTFARRVTQDGPIKQSFSVLQLSSWRRVKNFTTKIGSPHIQREWSCTLFWLKTSFTMHWPHFFNHFQARHHIRNALKLVLKIKVAFQYHWGLIPSILFLMFSWSRTLNQYADRFKVRVFIWGRKTLDSQPYCWLLYCWFS